MFQQNKGFKHAFVPFHSLCRSEDGDQYLNLVIITTTITTTARYILIYQYQFGCHTLNKVIITCGGNSFVCVYYLLND